MRIIDGKCEEFEREHNERMSLAWHIAALSRQKKIPPLSKLLNRTKKRTEQTWQQQLEIARMWANVKK